MGWNERARRVWGEEEGISKEIEQGEMSDAVSKSYEKVKRVLLWAGLI